MNETTRLHEMITDKKILFFSLFIWKNIEILVNICEILWFLSLMDLGGADGIRTRDLLTASQTRSQLRYGPLFQ